MAEISDSKAVQQEEVVCITTPERAEAHWLGTSSLIRETKHLWSKQLENTGAQLRMWFCLINNNNKKTTCKTSEYFLIRKETVPWTSRHSQHVLLCQHWRYSRSRLLNSNAHHRQGALNRGMAAWGPLEEGILTPAIAANPSASFYCRYLVYLRTKTNGMFFEVPGVNPLHCDGHQPKRRRSTFLDLLKTLLSDQNCPSNTKVCAYILSLQNDARCDKPNSPDSV